MLEKIALAARKDGCDVSGLLPTRKQLKSDIENKTAREILCAIAHNADMKTVLAALAAVKAPGTLDLIAEGIQAVRDRQ
jgi:hypothetical protein